TSAPWNPTLDKERQGWGTRQQNLLLHGQRHRNVVHCIALERVHVDGVSFGNRFAGTPGPTVTTMGGGGGGVLLPPPPQASSNPNSTSDTHRLATAMCLDILRPAQPTITIPASGNESGNHGKRRSALRRSLLFPAGAFGPAVLMIS